MAGQVPIASEAVEGERKVVTALFADLKGSTGLMERLDPEEARAIIDPALKIMVDAVRRYEGYVVQSTGDGIFALFGAPAAYEDHPQRSIHATLQMQHELREYAQRLAYQGLPAVEFRIGINTGEVVVRTVETGGKIEYTPIGHTANVASRLQTVAPAGSIAVSDRTGKLVEGYFELRELGPMQVRGVSEPLKVYEVIGLGPLQTHFQLSARRGLTRFVGRERELAEMKHALESSISGRGQIVAVVADAGTGKSRLFYEFKAALPAECRVLEAYSVSHGKASAWLPILELLRRYFGVQDEDDPARRREKVRSALATIDPALSDRLPYLFGLLGIQESLDPLAQMDPEVRGQRTLEAIKRIILRESLKQPTVIIFEDLHWVDCETQALLEVLADSIAGARLLLLVNYRPEYRHEWSRRSHYVQLRLDPLGTENARAMLAALLGEGAELDALRRQIAERTGGNPFFIEEMVQALFEQSILARNGAVTMVRPLAEAHLPVTVQGVLAARIDRLAVHDKELLQTLAVIGNEFSLTLARHVTQQPEETLQRGLASLRLGEFVYERPLPTDVEYSFKHALTHEVAYNSLLIERRKILHERVGQALESMFAENLADRLAELAHHYNHSNNVNKAIEYLGRAGQQALQRSAHTDAIANLTKAIELLQRLPEVPERIQRELMLQLPLGIALQVVRGYTAEAAKRALVRARELCERLGDPPELFQVLHGLWSLHLLRGERQETFGLAKQLLVRAEAACDSGQLLMAHAAVGMSLAETGDFRSVRAHLEKGISFYDRVGHRPPGLDDDLIAGLCYLAVTLLALGYPDQALEKSNRAVALSEELGRPFLLTFALQFSGLLRKELREPHTAQQLAERVIELSTEHGFAFWLAQATSLRGEAIADQGHAEQGIAQLIAGLAAMDTIGFTANREVHLVPLAKAYATEGRLDEALSTLEEAAPVAGQKEHYEAERLRLKGEFLLRRSDSDAGEARLCFERAIEIARTQANKWFELRTTVSLARLLARQGWRGEARTMLAEIYNWFTEGFDTADLKDARALLDDLPT
jgi:class 3 adenylate cyclase/tetratricopeptide (TPR) repeat protein